MKKKDKNSALKTERTLESIDHLQRVEANPYLYSKIQERLHQEPEQSSRLGTLWRFQIGVAFLLLLMMANVFTLLQYSPGDTARDTNITSLSEAYGWSESSSMGVYEGIYQE